MVSRSVADACRMSRAVVAGSGNSPSEGVRRSWCVSRPRSHAPHALKRGGYVERNYRWAGVASCIKMPWLNGRGRTPRLNIIQTPWRI
jgi:hypothetical protein